jgi:hypothetical protein
MMSDMKVLLLGWDVMPAVKGEQENGCFTMAKALGKRLDLSLILPVADPDYILQNVTLTGLNNIDLPALEPTGPKKDVQPFAEGPHIRQEIPLYGAPTHPASQQASARAQQAGQAMSAGILQQGSKLNKEVGESPNLFDQGDLERATLDAQVIQFARWATRLAAHRQFDVIYAYDWQTFLAGSELKLISEKPLVLQVHSLSQERQHPSSQGWVYQVEKQALLKADCIIAATDKLAALLEEKYQVSPGVINSLESKTAGPVVASLVASGGNSLAKGVPVRIQDGPEQAEIRDKAADRIRDILLNLAA